MHQPSQPLLILQGKGGDKSSQDLPITVSWLLKEKLSTAFLPLQPPFPVQCSFEDEIYCPLSIPSSSLPCPLPVTTRKAF